MDARPLWKILVSLSILTSLLPGSMVVQSAANPDFSIEFEKTIQTYIQGQYIPYPFSIYTTGGFNEPVSLAVTGLPEGFTHTWSANPAEAPGEGALFLTSTNTLRAPVELTVTGIAGTLEHSASLWLTPYAFADMGDGIRALVLRTGFFSTAANGDTVFYGVTSYLHPRLYRFNVTTEKVDLVVPIPEGEGSWALVMEGNDLYIGTYDFSHANALFRYHIDSGTLEKLFTLDANFAYCIKVYNRHVYLGLYPKGTIADFDIDAGTLAYLGPFTMDKYVRSIEFYGDKLYAGLGATAHLIEYSLTDGTRRELLPADYATDSFVYDQVRVGTKLFLKLDPSQRIVEYDLASGEFTQMANNWDQAAGTDQPDFSPDSVHFAFRNAGGSLAEWNTTHNTLERLLTSDSPFRIRCPECWGIRIVNEQYIQAVSPEGIYYKVDFGGHILHTVDLIEAGLEPFGEPVQSLTANQGRIFVAGSWRLRELNIPAKSDKLYSVLVEPKSMTLMGDELFTAHYPYARLYRYPLSIFDGAAPPDLMDPAYRFLEIQEQQNRPKKIISNEQNHTILVGTEPDYGLYGGALTYYDTVSGGTYSSRNIVPNQTIESMAYDSADPNIAYLGTSPIGGTGTTILDEPGHVVKWDLTTRNKLFDVIPFNLRRAVTSLISLPGKLLGVYESNCVFELDPGTGELLKYKFFTPHLLVLAANGQVYGETGAGIFRLNLDTLEPEYLTEGFKSLAIHYSALEADQAESRVYFIDH